MGWFDWLKPKPSAPPPGDDGISLPKLCYVTAYFILPHYAHQDFEKLASMVRETPSVAGPFCYAMACSMKGCEPVFEDGKQFRWQRIAHATGRELLVLEYPTPPPVDLAHLSDDQIITQMGQITLAPYFSGIVREPGGERVYFVLGQAPLGGGTTLRSVTADGANCNLGPGPIPTLEAFVEAITRGEA